MKKKILLLAFLLLCLTGCDATYRINFNDDNTITEEVTILAPNDFISADNLERDLQILIDFNSDEANEQGFYHYERILGDVNSGSKLSYTFANYAEFNNYSVFSKYCYDEVHVTMNNSVISVETSDNFKCFDELNNGNVRVEIPTQYVVKNHNADIVNDDIYVWNLSADDYDNSIIIEIDRTQKSHVTAIEQITNNSIIYIIIIGVVIVVLVGTIYYAYRRYQELNKF